jgi:di/tricarboxylate transporter
MSNEQLTILGILLAAVAMFLWGRWRHDMVAIGALLACVFAGVVPAAAAYAGFGHPAVVTVACVLVLSNGLQTSGAVDVLMRYVTPGGVGPTLTIAAFSGFAALLSSFMNNVGALALLMPAALQVAARQQIPAGRMLMPLAFGSILGGMTTLTGTPPNLIVSGFRVQTGMSSFGMFDFTPVGLAVAGVGLAFVALVGWRLVPARERAGTEGFETGAYLTEARVPEGSKAVGMRLREVEAVLDQADAQVVGLVRSNLHISAPNQSRVVRASDILVIEAEAAQLSSALANLGLTLEEARPKEMQQEQERSGDDGAERATDEAQDSSKQKASGPEEIVLVELAVLPHADVVGRSASDLRLRTRYGINLLAVSRGGRRSMSRLRTMVVEAGDVLLMQGPPDALAVFAAQSGCVPLAERALRIPDKKKAIIASLIMLFAIGGAALGLVPAAISFAAGVLVSMAARTVSLRAVYDAVDWPVIVLLAALIPVATAMQTTGTADLIAQWLLENVARGHAIAALALILLVSMTLSDVMNNAATAAVMCPIAIGTAAQLGVRADSFLMAVAIGASCAFLTPIGHQNNTLILGPGGFRFGDYWRLGLPLEILVLATGIPMLVWVWGL